MMKHLVRIVLFFLISSQFLGLQGGTSQGGNCKISGPERSFSEFSRN